MPNHVRVRWFGADTRQQAVEALVTWGKLFLEKGNGERWLLSLGDRDAFHQALDRRLAAAKLPYRSHPLREVLLWDKAQTAGLAGIVCGYADARRLTEAARALARHEVLNVIPFEYTAGLNPERSIFARLDEYAGTHFVAPSLLDSPTPYELYEESLSHFEQKCGLRDFLDLYQMIRFVVVNGVPGNIAEFGSYKGHSGYLIARTLQALKSDKRLYMFDTFAGFPQETFGVDHHWNKTHGVDFGSVRAKFAAFGTVHLVQGDFTATLAASGAGPLALAYIDCDSYRATRFLIDRLWERHLSHRAALVCEDYGHPALLGNRAAVHEELDHRRGAFTFFSQFSGLHITLKL